MPLSNVARFLPECARTQPGTCAVRAPAGDDPRTPGAIRYVERTFGELNAESDAAARLFRERGITRGTRVLLLVKPGLDLLRCAFALLKLGAVPVLIDPGMGLKNFLSCVRRSEPAALVAISRAHWLARFLRGAFASAKIRVKVGGAEWERGLAARQGEPFPLAATNERDLAAILFTSGSTGAPKGVCYEHAFFEAQVALIRERYGIEPGEIDFPILPIFALFNPALGMATIVPEINPSRPATCDPARAVQAIRQNNVTNSFGSPALWNRLARHCENTGQTLPSLRRVLVAGAPVHPSLLRRLKRVLPNAAVHIPYGATEALPVASISADEVLRETAALTEQGQGSCLGGLFPGMEAEVIQLREDAIARIGDAVNLPPGQIGEIIVRGPVVTREYDRLPDATARAKIADENGTGIWHRMGDLGYRDHQGRLWFCGRAAERVETHDGLYYTDCVEAVFNRHLGVARTALIGLGPRPRQTAALIVEPAPGHFPATRAVQEKFMHELRALETPAMPKIAHYFFRKALPVDVRHNAKIHRLALGREYGKYAGGHS